jgi:hypothetical protein
MHSYHITMHDVLWGESGHDAFMLMELAKAATNMLVRF